MFPSRTSARIWASRGQHSIATSGHRVRFAGVHSIFTAPGLIFGIEILPYGLYDVFMDDSFEWDEYKNQENQQKHGVSFQAAQFAFADPHLLILRDERHSMPAEERFYAVGRIEGGIVTVRFTMRNKHIRIFWAGFWRKYRGHYLKQASIIS